MLDIRYIRDNLEEVIKRLNTRGQDFTYLKEVVAKDALRREFKKLKKC